MAIARRLLLMSVPVLVVLAFALLLSAPEESYATATGSPVACEAGNITGTVENLPALDDVVNVPASSGSVINTICIRTGLNSWPFPTGTGDCQNSGAFHSPCITADGKYVNVEPCSVSVSGMGTSKVTVTSINTATCSFVTHVDYIEKATDLGDCVPPGPNDSALAHCANTSATVGGSNGGAPVVLQKWELPDMDPIASGIQYQASLDGTEPCVWNATNTQYINTPCIDDNGNDIPNKNTGEFGHYHHDDDPCKLGDLNCQLTVTPNVDDKPEKRAIEIWAVVSDDTGGIGDVASVQAIVSHVPNDCPGGAGAAGCLPVKKDTDPLHPVPLAKQSCEELFGPEPPEPSKGETDPESPIHAAVNTGQLLHGKLLQEDCEQQEWAVYAGYFLLNNDQPWGKYTVCVQAIDTNSNLGQRCNLFFVQNVVAFKLDFSTVNFGAITAGVSKTVSPGNVTNTGNADACIGVLFGEMEGKSNQNVIDTFGAEIKGLPSGPYTAGLLLVFDAPIESKGENKLRFTVYPPAPLAPDTYQGRVDLEVKKCDEIRP